MPAYIERRLNEYGFWEEIGVLNVDDKLVRTRTSNRNVVLQYLSGAGESEKFKY